MQLSSTKLNKPNAFGVGRIASYQAEEDTRSSCIAQITSSPYRHARTPLPPDFTFSSGGSHLM
eukprot:1866508-Rhodomonas_salina.1